MLDAFVAASWYLERQNIPAAQALLSLQPAPIWRAPACLAYEVLNLLLRQEAWTALSPGSAELAWRDLKARLKLELDAHPSDTELMDVAKLARRYRLSLFDSLYLQLTLKLRGALVTRDGPLIAAARREGCPVHDVRALS